MLMSLCFIKIPRVFQRQMMFMHEKLNCASAFYFIFILFYKFAIAIDLYRVLWLQMTGISTQR
jgi:hypothetical protein